MINLIFNNNKELRYFIYKIYNIKNTIFNFAFTYLSKNIAKILNK